MCRPCGTPLAFGLARTAYRGRRRPRPSFRTSPSTLRAAVTSLWVRSTRPAGLNRVIAPVTGFCCQTSRIGTAPPGVIRKFDGHAAASPPDPSRPPEKRSLKPAVLKPPGRTAMAGMPPVNATGEMGLKEVRPPKPGGTMPLIPGGRPTPTGLCRAGEGPNFEARRFTPRFARLPPNVPPPPVGARRMSPTVVSIRPKIFPSPSKKPTTSSPETWRRCARRQRRPESRSRPGRSLRDAGPYSRLRRLDAVLCRCVRGRRLVVRAARRIQT